MKTIKEVQYEEKIKELQERINKAIEYISDYKNYCDEEECYCTPKYFEELLNILKGKEIK